MTGRRAVATALAALALAAATVLCAGCGASTPSASSASSAAPPSGGLAAVYVHLREVAPPVATPDVATTGWPFAGDPGSFGEPFTSTLDAWPDGRCALLPAATVDAAVAALGPDVLAPIETASGWRSGTLGWSARGRDVLLMVGPAGPIPDGTSCADVWMAQFDPAGGQVPGRYSPA